MKENDIIKSLKNLRDVQPSSYDMHVVQRKIYARTNFQPGIKNSRRKFVYAIMSALAILLLIVGFVSQTTWLRTQLYQSRIAATQSTYQKAQLALELSKQDEANLQSASKYEDIQRLRSSIQDTNKYLSKLDLHGEPGKYTEEQCRNLYNSFYHYLENTEHTVDTMKSTAAEKNKKDSLSELQKELQTNEQQAAERLATYDK